MRKSLTKIFWNIEVWAVQKHVNLVDLVKGFPTSIYYLQFWIMYLQNLASIQPRTSPVKFAGSIVLFRYFELSGIWGEGTQDVCEKKEKLMEKERKRKRTSSGVAKTQPQRELENYVEGWSDASELDADSYTMRECFRSTIHLRRG